MAVTTSYSFNLIQNTDLTQGPTTSQADATSLADGGFAVSGSHVGHTDFDIFNADLSDAGGANVFGFTSSAIDQVSTGNIVIVGQDADSVRYVVTTGVGAIAFAETDFGDADSSNPDVAALSGGGFWVVAQDEIGAAGGDADIDVYIRNNDGAFLNFFTVDSSLARDTNARVAALDNGGVVVTWERTIGADTEIWYAVYNSAGGVVQGPTIADTIGTINRNVDVAAKNNGFVLVYEDNGWGTGTTDITLAEFDLSGTFQVYNNISNPTFINDFSNDANATVTRLSNGLLVVGYENNAFGDTDSVVKLFDANTNTVLATRFVTGGESIADDTGEITIAGSAFGGVNVFHTNLSDSDVDGEALQIRRTSTSDGAGDAIVGDELVDVMNGAGGADSLSGGANNDILSGDAGNDTLIGGADNDTLNGGADNDILIGGAGNDTLDGGPDRDTANYAGLVAVTVNLGLVTPQNISGHGTDTLTGVENLLGSDASDTLIGSSFANVLTGGAGNDNLHGGVENDTLFGGAGNDGLYGGAGLDTASYAGSAAVTVSLAIAGAQNTAGGGTDILNGIENLTGTSGNDTLTGDGGPNALSGGLQNDVLDGAGGEDTLIGGAGNDLFIGGAGNDTVSYAPSGLAIVVDLGLAGAQNTGDGVDTFSSIENLVGSSLVDRFTGNFFDNRFDGGLAADVLRGGSGNDALNGDSGADLIVGDFGEDIIDGGADADRLYGGTSNDQLFGGAGGDTLSGGPGHDRLDGGDGSDRLYGDTTADTFVFNTLAGLGDRVFSFRTGVHELEFDISVFGGTTGAFAFVANTNPSSTSAQQTFLHDTDGGFLYFDRDGTGAAAPLYILTLYAAPALAAGDIALV